jgi:hypothetical protein
MALKKSRPSADADPMDTSRTAMAHRPDAPEVDITPAAIRAFGRLWHAVSTDLQTHPSGDGGLICEDRRSSVRPTLWRVAPDGTIHPDSPYSFRLRQFVPASVPVRPEGREPGPLATA